MLFIRECLAERFPFELSKEDWHVVVDSSMLRCLALAKRRKAWNVVAFSGAPCERKALRGNWIHTMRKDPRPLEEFEACMA